MRTPKNIKTTLLAAAALVLFAAAGVSCGRRGPSQETPPPSPDTLALVEGLRLFEEGEYDTARNNLLVSARSTSTYIRAESFLYLNALEMELGNYAAAGPWLENYFLESVCLLRGSAEQARLAAEQTARLRRRQDAIIVSVVVLVLAMAGAVVFFTRRRPRPGEAVYAGGTVHGDGTATGDGVAHTGGAATAAEPDTSGWGRWLVEAEVFRRTPMWDEIAALGAQTPGRGARVLTTARQDALDAELGVRFADFSTWLRADYPSLTAGDVKLCCLALLPLSPFGRALCFGSTETNIVKQRKHTIKKKLTADPRGRALFDFIFETRTIN